MKPNIVHISVILISILLAGGCKQSTPTDLTLAGIIPKPASVTATGGAFEFNDETIVYVQEGADDLVSVAQRLVSQLNLATGFTNQIKTIDHRPENGIYLHKVSGNDNKEAYEVMIDEQLVAISSGAAHGVFNGVQTFAQLVPFGAMSKQYSIPTGTITDQPTYQWRGAMLDVARHFFSVEDVKRYIDLISYYKYNVLHLHLTDDQGWRIEIKSWPNLTKHGGSTEVGGGAGGYYTQEDYMDIVAYAQSRFITIVPEIDMPGHVNAALASYGELNGGIVVPKEGRVERNSPILGEPKNTELYTGIEVGWSTLMFDNETTFRFVSDVLQELSSITPGPYIHIGGDEAQVTNKEDYIKFINSFKKMVASNGKQMIGWEEIAQADVDSSDIVQLWRSSDYGQQAIAKGSKVLMSPSTKTYLDMKYDTTTVLGLNWAGYIEVDASYSWDPATYLGESGSENIIGVEAPLWSETITNMDELEYLAFPRVIAIAEVGWTPFAARSWDEFKGRLNGQLSRLKALGVDYYNSPLIAPQ